jgi:hypothetical protein
MDLSFIEQNLRSVAGARAIVVAGEAGEATFEDCSRSPVTVAEANASGGKYLQGDVKWLVPRGAGAPALRPAPGDVIQEADAGGLAETSPIYWFVYSVEDACFGYAWRLWCKAYAVSAAETLLVYAVGRKVDAEGAPAPTWSQVAEVEGSVVELAQEIETSHDQRRVKITHAVFLDPSVEVKPGYRLERLSGEQLSVVRVSSGGVGSFTLVDAQAARTPEVG